MSDPARRYDQRYFDRWYRDPRHRVFTAAERARRAALAVSATEYLLGRPIRSVLDVGAGEGHWRAPLMRLRPRLRYTGVDPSPYVVRRFGKRRNIRLGTVTDLDIADFDAPFDLVLAVGFLNLLSETAFPAGLDRIVPFVGGVALLELFTNRDPLTGDVRKYTRSTAERYRRVIGRAGLVPIGFHLYATRSVAEALSDLEFGCPPARNPPPKRLLSGE